MSKRKLLLADDSVTIQKVVNLTFADEGIEVISVGDGDSAMTKILETSPDLVMLDVNMPGLSGYEICESLRGSEQYRNLPIILLVGSFEPFDEDEARRVGANDYLTKPFQSIRQLVSTVTGLLASNETRVEPNPAVKLSEASTAEYPSFIVPETNSAATLPHIENDIPQWENFEPEHDDEAVNLETGNLDANYPASLNQEEDILETENFTEEVEEIEDIQQKSYAFDAPEQEFPLGIQNTAVETVDSVPVFQSTVFEDTEIEETEYSSLPSIDDELLESTSEIAENEEVRSEVFSEAHIETPENIAETYQPIKHTPVEEPIAEAHQVTFEDAAVETIDEESTSDSLLEVAEKPQFESLPFPEAASILELDENNLLEIAPREEDFLVNIGEDDDFDSEIKFGDSTFPVGDGLEIDELDVPVAAAVDSPKQSLKLDESDIDEIVRRVIEKLSDSMIREVAWEVVPYKADQILKQIIQEKLENS